MAEPENSNNHWLGSLITSILGDGKLFSRAIILLALLGIGYLIYWKATSKSEQPIGGNSKPDTNEIKRESPVNPKDYKIRIKARFYWLDNNSPIRNTRFRILAPDEKNGMTLVNGNYIEDFNLRKNPNTTSFIVEFQSLPNNPRESLELIDYSPIIEGDIIIYELGDIVLTKDNQKLNYEEDNPSHINQTVKFNINEYGYILKKDIESLGFEYSHSNSNNQIEIKSSSEIDKLEGYSNLYYHESGYLEIWINGNKYLNIPKIELKDIAITNGESKSKVTEDLKIEIQKKINENKNQLLNAIKKCLK